MVNPLLLEMLIKGRDGIDPHVKIFQPKMFIGGMDGVRVQAKAKQDGVYA